LLITTEGDFSADLIVLALQSQGTPFFRFNTDAFPQSTSIGWNSDTETLNVSTDTESIEISHFRSAWFRRFVPIDGTDFIRQECLAYLEGIFQVQPIHWMNRPSSVRIAELKIVQLAVAKESGFQVPKTVVGNDLHAARSLLSPDTAVVVKSLSTSSVEMEGQRYRLFSQALDWDDIDEGSLRCSPCIIQELAKPGIDIRVTVVGEYFFPVAIIPRRESGNPDWRSLPDEDLDYQVVELPADLKRSCRTMMLTLDLEYAAFDLIWNGEDRYMFLEVNPSGQWGWIDRHLDLGISETIAAHLVTISRTKSSSGGIAR